MMPPTDPQYAYWAGRLSETLDLLLAMPDDDGRYDRAVETVAEYQAWTKARAADTKALAVRHYGDLLAEARADVRTTGDGDTAA
jgi:hypothetical protein